VRSAARRARLLVASGLWLTACDTARQPRTGVDSTASVDTAAPPGAAASQRPVAPPPLPPRGAPDSLVALLIAPDSLLDRLATREVDYEGRALTVYAIVDGWYLVGTLDSARQWLRASGRDSVLPLETLLVGRLNYLTADWDGSVRTQPDPAAPLVGRAGAWRASGEDRDETPANVLRAQQTASGLWLEVQVLASTGCDGDTPRIRTTGWIPAWGAHRSPTAWFFSRGC
jgi:hypothetical protein